MPVSDDGHDRQCARWAALGCDGPNGNRATVSNWSAHALVTTCDSSRPSFVYRVLFRRPFFFCLFFVIAQPGLISSVNDEQRIVLNRLLVFVLSSSCPF